MYMSICWKSRLVCSLFGIAISMNPVMVRAQEPGPTDSSAATPDAGDVSGMVGMVDATQRGFLGFFKKVEIVGLDGVRFKVTGNRMVDELDELNGAILRIDGKISRSPDRDESLIAIRSYGVVQPVSPDQVPRSFRGRIEIQEGDWFGVGDRVVLVTPAGERYEVRDEPHLSRLWKLQGQEVAIRGHVRAPIGDTGLRHFTIIRDIEVAAAGAGEKAPAEAATEFPGGAEEVGEPAGPPAGGDPGRL